MVNELIAKLPETVIQAIRARTFTARPEVDLTDIRLLSRQLSQAFAEGDDIMPLMPAYARLIDELIERPASCWSADTREIHDAIWPFLASAYVTDIEKSGDFPVNPSIREFTQFAKEWIVAREAEAAMPVGEADALIRAEMERVRALYPRLGMSYGYIGNCGHNYDDRWFMVFTQVTRAKGDDRTERFGDHPTGRLTKLHTLVMKGLEEWAHNLNERLDAGEVYLRSTRHLEAA